MVESFVMDAGWGWRVDRLQGIPGERGGVAGGEGWYEGEYDGVLGGFVEGIAGGGTGGWLWWGFLMRWVGFWCSTWGESNNWEKMSIVPIYPTSP